MANTPFFGRQWQLQILTPPDQGSQVLYTIGSMDDQSQELRMEFEVEAQANTALWQATIKVYNPEPGFFAAVTQDSEVSLAAGYLDPVMGEIFRGKVFQPKWTKLDATDVCMELVCITGLAELVDGIVKCNVGPLATQREVVLEMAKAAGLSTGYVAPDADFAKETLPRSQTIFGRPDMLFAQYADHNNLNSYYGPDGLNMGKLLSGEIQPSLEFAPPIPEGSLQRPLPGVTYSVIGTPQQTETGVNFRTLLDSRVRVLVPGLIVRLRDTDGGTAQVSQRTFVVNKSLPTTLSHDGSYVVYGVVHLGDTRGNTWETQVLCVNSVSGLLGYSIY